MTNFEDGDELKISYGTENLIMVSATVAESIMKALPDLLKETGYEINDSYAELVTEIHQDRFMDWATQEVQEKFDIKDAYKIFEDVNILSGIFNVLLELYISKLALGIIKVYEEELT